MTELEKKLKELGYTRHIDKYYKWVNDWRICFKVEYYENDCCEWIPEIVDYSISPFGHKCINKVAVNEVIDILEHDLKELGQC